MSMNNQISNKTIMNRKMEKITIYMKNYDHMMLLRALS